MTRPLDTDLLSTLEEARSIAAFLGGRVGGGVLPEDSDPEKSGIFRLDWVAVPGADEPAATDANGGKYLPYLFRFANGAQGICVGLVRHSFRQCPTSPDWVLMRLALEANTLAGGPAY